MLKLFSLVLVVFKGMIVYGAMSLSPLDFDIDLLNSREKKFTVSNIGESEAFYTVEVSKKTDLSRYVAHKKEIFKLLPGEKREIVLNIDIEEREIKNQEYLGRFNILEQRKVKNINYETNTGITLYGYAGELKEKFALESFKNEKNILIGEIVNRAEKKIDVLLTLLNEKGEILMSRKIRILRGKRFNLSDLGEILELEKGKKILLESSDMREEREVRGRN